MTTLIESLLQASRTSEGVTFVDRDEEQFFPYLQILERARRVAGGLRAIGIERGERVGISIPTSIAFYDAFFGALFAGAAPVSLPLPPPFGDRATHNRSVKGMLSQCDGRLLLNRTTLDGLPRAGDAQSEPRPEELALVQFSSGTTEGPKPIPLTHRQVLANVRTLLGAFLSAYPEHGGFRHIGVSWLPLYHDMGLIGAVLAAMAHPGPLFLLKPEQFIARPASWLRAISRYAASLSAAPHFAYELCLERVRDEELEGVDLSCWRLALDGAEMVGPGTLDRFAERFARFGLRPEALTPVYGLAEAALAVTFGNPHALPSVRERDGQQLVSCGRPLPGYHVRIAEGGKILIRGPSIMNGYLGMPEESSEILRDGWLDTGDLGFIEDGELYVTGRSKELVIVRGRNYSPTTIERTVKELPGVFAVVAVNVATDRGEKLALLIESEGDGFEGRVRSVVSERLGIDPDYLLFLAPGKLPRTTSGKLKRSEAVRLIL
ncbi:MAG TPA: AMP-binding protein [Vicinamibacteria bacterium]|nr:AMP-binding protein [Vicinamibacteria bacterium]